MSTSENKVDEVNEDAVASASQQNENIAEDGQKKFSIQRFLINRIVRTAFFLAPAIPIADGFFLPIGLTIFVIGGFIGGVLDIMLSRNVMAGGKVMTWAFNVGTLSFFEGIEFNINVGTSGKGVSLKDVRE